MHSFKSLWYEEFFKIEGIRKGFVWWKRRKRRDVKKKNEINICFDCNKRRLWNEKR